MYISEEIKERADELSRSKTHWLNRTNVLRYTNEYEEELEKLLEEGSGDETNNK